MRRALIQAEISEAISKGAQDCNTFVGFEGEGLQDQFNVVADASEHMLENFYPFKFWERRNFLKPESELQSLLLGAFEAVSFMEELNTRIGVSAPEYSSNNTVIDKQKGKLSSAYYMYVTNGQSSAVGKEFFQNYVIHFLRNKQSLIV